MKSIFGPDDLPAAPTVAKIEAQKRDGKSCFVCFEQRASGELAENEGCQSCRHYRRKLERGPTVEAQQMALF